MQLGRAVSVWCVWLTTKVMDAQGELLQGWRVYWHKMASFVPWVTSDFPLFHSNVELDIIDFCSLLALPLDNAMDLCMCICISMQEWCKVKWRCRIVCGIHQWTIFLLHRDVSTAFLNVGAVGLLAQYILSAVMFLGCCTIWNLASPWLQCVCLFTWTVKMPAIHQLCWVYSGELWLIPLPTDPFWGIVPAVWKKPLTVDDPHFILSEDSLNFITSARYCLWWPVGKLQIKRKHHCTIAIRRER